MKEITFNIYNIKELKEVADIKIYNKVLEKARVEEIEFIKNFQYADLWNLLDDEDFQIILDNFNIQYNIYDNYEILDFNIISTNYSVNVFGARAYGKGYNFIKELEKITYLFENLFIVNSLIEYLKKNIIDFLQYGFCGTIRDALNNIVKKIEETNISDNEIIEILLNNEIYYTEDGKQWIV